MNRELKSYIDAEIPQLSGYPRLLRPLALRRIRRYQPSYDAVYMLRYSLLFAGNGNLFQRRRAKEYKRLLVRRYGVYFSAGADSAIGKGLKLPHPTSIVIGAGVKIGDNCVIYQNVTVGGARRGEAAQGKYLSLIHI